MECKFLNYISRWQLSKSTNISHTFLHSLLSFQRYRYKIFKCLPSKSRSRSRSAIFSPFDGKCQNLQMSPTHNCTSSYRFRDIEILKFLPPKVGQGHGVQFSQLQHSMANVKIYKCQPNILRKPSLLQRYKNFKLFTSKK